MEWGMTGHKDNKSIVKNVIKYKRLQGGTHCTDNPTMLM